MEAKGGQLRSVVRSLKRLGRPAVNRKKMPVEVSEENHEVGVDHRRCLEITGHLWRPVEVNIGRWRSVEVDGKAVEAIPSNHGRNSSEK